MIFQNIGVYKIEERLQSKELYTVYVAHDSIIKDNVLLKVLSHKISDNAEVTKKYLEAAANYSRLAHPNILQLLRADQEEGYTYLAFEKFHLKTINEYLAEHHDFSFKQIMDMFVKICGALDYAHQYAILHKNITAENILVSPEANVKLANFGVSFIELMHTEIKQGQIPEDFQYFSPEKIKQETLDEKSDIYSLGILLYYMLAKKYPFEANNTEELINAKLSGAAKDISVYNHGINPGMQAIINKMINANKSERYNKIKETLDDINKLDQEFNYKIDISPKQANWFMNKAREAYMSRQTNLSAENWEKASSSDPYNPNIHISIAKLYAEAGDLEKAITNYCQALDISPYHAKWRGELASVYKKNKNYEMAAAQYDLLRTTDKTFPGVYFNYGNCLFYLKKYEEAVSAWNEGLKHDKDNLKYFFNIGVGNYYLNKREEAVKNWKEVTQINTKFVKAIYNLSIMELAAGNYDKAFGLWSEVDKISGISNLKLHMGNHYYKADSFEQAMHYWESAVSLDSKCWQAYFNMGVYYFGKDNDKAKEFFEKTISIKSDYWSAYWNIAYIYKEKNETEKADEFFNKVMEFNQGYWQINYYEGEKFLQDGRFEEAIKYFTNIIKSGSGMSDDRFYKNMGILFYKNNEKDKAVDWFAKSVSYGSFQWDAKDAVNGIPENIYKASKIMVEKELKEKEDTSGLFTVEDQAKITLKPELVIADCKEINTIIDY